MPIELRKDYSDMLDEVYAAASLTSDLTADKKLIKAGSHAKSVLYPTVNVDGLADYSRNSGYVDGSIDVEYTEFEFDYDRGRKFKIDAVDDQESFDVLLGVASGTFLRTKVAPEDDAFTFAKIAEAEGISMVPAGITYADGSEALKAIVKANAQMTEDEVPKENRFLYITPTLHEEIKALDTTKSREVLKGFTKIIEVPQGRFYTAIKMLSGKTEDGEAAGGYTKADDGKDINFLIIQKEAVIKINKHVADKLIRAEENQTADAHLVMYRKYGTTNVVKNKVAGIYLSHKE